MSVNNCSHSDATAFSVFDGHDYSFFDPHA